MTNTKTRTEKENKQHKRPESCSLDDMLWEQSGREQVGGVTRCGTVYGHCTAVLRGREGCASLTGHTHRLTLTRVHTHNTHLYRAFVQMNNKSSLHNLNTHTFLLKGRIRGNKIFD